LNNNDTNERFITKYGQEMARISTALLLTLPGLPCIYTGDEIGAEFHPYQNPEPLDWNEKIGGWRDYHKKLIRLRKEIPSLHSRLWKPLVIKPVPQEVYAYVRYTGSSQDPVLIALNFSEEDTTMEIEIPDEFQAMLSDGSMLDLLTDKAVDVKPGNTLEISVPGLTAKILKAA
jgi:glycosidase